MLMGGGGVEKLRGGKVERVRGEAERRRGVTAERKLVEGNPEDRLCKAFEGESVKPRGYQKE